MTIAASGNTVSYTRIAGAPADSIADVVVALQMGDVAAGLVAGSGNVANASAVATLTGAATTTVYIGGFEITGSGATAGLPVLVTVVGLLGGTRTYIYTFEAGVLVGNKPLTVTFVPPAPASAINTAIVVTCPASGAGGTNNAVVAHGFHR